MPPTWDHHRELEGQLCHIVQGDFTPILAKHSKNFSTEDPFAIGVDRIQREFEPLRHQT